MSRSDKVTARRAEPAPLSALKLAAEFKGGLTMGGLAKKYGLTTRMVEERIRNILKRYR